MAKIKSLTVRGYQSHVDSFFPLSPTLTVITGPSDGGKTGGTLRVLRWLAEGEPSGDDFLHTLYDPDTGDIRSQAEQVQVIAEMDDGVTIEKIRRKKKTTHLISTVAEPFEKAETPEEVNAILGIHRYNFGDFETALNFAYQLEPPFLISESPSAGAKVLGKLAGTEDVDKAIKAVSKDTHAVRKQRDTASAEIEKYTGSLLDYLFLEDAIQALSGCEDLILLVDQQDNKRARLISLSGKHDQDHAAVETLTATLETLKNVEAAREQLDTFEIRTQHFIRLEKLLGDHEVEIYNILAADQEIKRLAGTEEAALLLSRSGISENLVIDLKNLLTLYTTYSQSAATAAHDDKIQKLEVFKNLKILADCYFIELAAAEDTLVNTKYLSKAEAALQQLDTKVQMIQEIQTVLNDYANAEQHLQDAAQAVAKYNNIPAADQIQVIDDKLGKLKIYMDLGNDYLTRYAAVTAGSNAITFADKEIKAADEELKEAWIETGGTCPLCEQEILNL